MKTFEIKNVIGRSQTMKLNKALPNGVRFAKVYGKYFVTDRSGAKHEVNLFHTFEVDSNGRVHNVRKVA